MKSLSTMDKLSFYLKFNICKLVIITNQINRLKNKNHMSFLIDTVKAFDKIQHILVINVSESMGL